MSDVELPAGWVVAPLSDLVPPDGIFTDGDWVESKDQDPEGDVRLIQLADVGDGYFRDRSSRSMTRQKANELRCTFLQEGDVLVARMPEPLGRACLYPGSKRPAVTVVDVCIIRTGHGGVDNRWLMWAINSPQVRQQIDSYQTGTTRKRISRKNLEKIRLAVPPLAEQHRIVEAVEDHLSRLDAATEAVGSAKGRIKPFTASVLDRTALGTSSTASLDQGVAVDDSQRMLAGLSSKRFDYTALPALPRDWFWRRSSDVCEFISSGSTPKSHLMHSGSGDVPFLKVYNITQDGRIDFTNKPTYVDRETHENQLRRSRVRPGDVLTNIVGPPLGKTAIVPDLHPEWNINQAIVAFRAGHDVHPEWLSLALRSPFVLGMLQKTAKATAGQFNIALSTCRELPLPIPPMDVQLDLVAQSAELLEVSNRFASQVAGISFRSRHLRHAVLRRAFNGELVSQDPADEPVSVLLDRIRAEREAQGAKPRRAVRRPREAAATADASSPPPAPSSPSPITAVQQELPL